MPASSKAKPRQAWVLLHRYAGLFMAFFLILAGLTGTVIAFQDEFDRALNPELFRITERGDRPLSVDELVEKVRRTHPNAFVTQLYLDRKPGESVRVRLAPRIDPLTQQTYVLPHTEIFLDPFDGRVLGGRERGIFHADRAHLMPFMDKLHYTLAVPGYWGEWFMGVVALVWTFDCFVGFYLTLPARKQQVAPVSDRSWWRRWQLAWAIKYGASPTRLNFDIHRASGLWLWPLLLLLATSGVYFNLTNEVFRPVLSLFGKLTPVVTDTLSTSPNAHKPAVIPHSTALLHARAALSVDSRQMIPSYVGLTGDAPGMYKVRFTDPDRGNTAWRFRIEELYVDGATGEILVRTGHHVGTTGDKVIFWQYPLHSGKIFGFWGRAFMSFIGLLIAVLSVTGVIIWLKKQRQRNFSRGGIARAFEVAPEPCPAPDRRIADGVGTQSVCRRD